MRQPRLSKWRGLSCVVCKTTKRGDSLSELPASLCRAALAGLRFTAVFASKSRLQASDRRRRPWRPSENRPPDTRLPNIRFLSAKRRSIVQAKLKLYFLWSYWWGLNPRPADYESGARMERQGKANKERRAGKRATCPPFSAFRHDVRTNRPSA